MAFVTYAIGDVHGEAERYRRLVDHVFNLHDADYRGLDMRIVQVGDLIDRGPDSFGAINFAIELERDSAANVIHLRGNHEQMLLDAFDSNTGGTMDYWIENGGAETMRSYHDAGYESLPPSHLDWLGKREHLYLDEPSKIIVVHAGVDVDAYPNCRESVRLWTRSPKFFDSNSWTNAALDGWCVIHGHTPTEGFMPEVDGDRRNRINVDTGAVFGGRLTAAVVSPEDSVRFLYA